MPAIIVQIEPDKVIEFISDIIVNEFKFKPDSLDSDILAIDESYNKSSGSCFWYPTKFLYW
ncbi:MAG: hypothetical protein JO297_07700 [Nitrososphaeraceae archaeon]|nr:hypothetical protein [Nitrososphaeraceae archaeon]